MERLCILECGTKSDVLCCGLLVALGSLPCVEGLVKSPVNHPCSYFTFHQLILKLVFFVVSVPFVL